MTTDYKAILADADIAGVFETPPGAADDIVNAAKSNEQALYRIDLRGARNREEMLQLIGTALEFPEWYGNNFDGLMDCLCDMGWQPAPGYVVVLENSHNIYNIAYNDFNLLIDVFAEAAVKWREQDKPFWCFVDQAANI
ncbi:MAG TPA: barstar family protein [Rhodocyclaceae bacterium]|jgi:RNAse (barnase) inhibitor barstar|nr:barstar family protein [Rhodocyclaceae bacterium]